MLRAMHEQCAEHLPVALHERTNELTNAEPPNPPREMAVVGNAHARVLRSGFVYLVHWPEAGFTKVGSSVDGKRWRPFLRRGGVLLGVIEPTDQHHTIVEWEMHVDLGTARVPRKFSTSAEAAPYLGGIGRGFSECYVDTTGREVLACLIAAARRRGA